MLRFSSSEYMLNKLNAAFGKTEIYPESVMPIRFCLSIYFSMTILRGYNQNLFKCLSKEGVICVKIYDIQQHRSQLAYSAQCCSDPKISCNNF